jgi:hypothetical protein
MALSMLPKDEEFHQLKNCMETLKEQNAYLLLVVTWITKHHGGSFQPPIASRLCKSPLLQLLTWMCGSTFLSGSSCKGITCFTIFHLFLFQVFYVWVIGSLAVLLEIVGHTNSEFKTNYDFLTWFPPLGRPSFLSLFFYSRRLLWFSWHLKQFRHLHISCSY